MKMPKLKVKIGKLTLENPVMVASGTFGYAEEFKEFFDLRQLGALVTKTITLNPRQGNPAPRTCETPSGLLNSIGLENPGLKVFLKEKLPFLKNIKVPLILSIAAEKEAQEFVSLTQRLDDVRAVGAIELNISCPNIKNLKRATQGGKLIAQDAEETYDVVRAVRRVTQKTLITKLSPNVSDIVAVARAAEAAGSDALSLINTFSAMAIDIKTRRPKIAAITGGLSGPAVKPIAIRMIWEAYQQIKIPIVGMGGIMTAEDALEFILAGATAVSIGTANFINPGASIEIIAGIKNYLLKNKIKDINELTGRVKR